MSTDTQRSQPPYGEPSSWSISETAVDHRLTFTGPVIVDRIMMVKPANGTLTCKELPDTTVRSTSQQIGGLGMVASDTTKYHDTPFPMGTNDRLDFLSAGVTGTMEITVDYRRAN